jgi:5'-nucleotidase
MVRTIYLLIGAGLVLAACRDEPIARLDCVTLAATTDVHGVVEPQTLTVGPAALRRSGLLAASGYVSILRQRFGRRLLLVDAGDLWQGTLVAKVSRGEAIVAAFNLMGYEAVALGNHEFDYGATSPDAPDLHGILEARVAQARFPFLAANMLERKTGRMPAWPNLKASVMLDVGGVPVGVVGAITPDVPKVTLPQLVLDFDFVDPVPIIAHEARELRANGARLVVLVAHFGGKCGKVDLADDLTSCDAESELFTILGRLPRGTVDAAVGGHTHGHVAHWLGDTAIVQPMAQAKELGWAELCIRPRGGIDRAASTLHPLVDLCLDEWVDGGCKARSAPAAVVPAKFLGQPVVPQSDLEATMATYLQAVAESAHKPLGVRLPRALKREGDGVSLGNRICEAMVEATGAKVAVQNLGGVRDDLPAGPLSYGDVFKVLPFENRVVTFDLTGEQIRKLVDLLTARREGALPYVAGLSVRLLPGGTEVQLASGAPLEDDAVFTLATNDYLGAGGEGAEVIFGNLPPERRHITEQTVLEAFITFLQARSADRAAR